MEEYHHLILTSRQLNTLREITISAFLKATLNSPEFLSLRSILTEINELKTQIAQQAEESFLRQENQ